MDENNLDVYDAIMPVYVLSKILGLAPFYLRGIRGNRCFQSDVGPIIIVRFIGVISIMLYAIYFIEELNFPFDLRSLALRCELYMGTILTTTMLLTAIFMRKILISAIEDLKGIDDYMRRAGISVPYKNARTFCTCQIIFITCVFGTKAIMQPFIGSKALIVIYNIFNIVDYINTITLFQYVNMIVLLRQRYIWLNRKIKIWAALVESDYDTIMLWKDEQLKRPLLVKSAHETDILYNDHDVGIKLLGKIHNDLYHLSQKINRIYSVRLLITVGMRMVMILTQLLTLYKFIFNNHEMQNSLTWGLIGIYLFLHTSKLFMIASLSAEVTDKANQSGIYLHNVWKCSARLKKYINIFSLQILQQDLKFEAGGFFILDYTLIYNIIAALTIYLIIIIQFDI